MNKKPTNWWGQAKRRNTQIRPKAVGGGIFGHFSNVDECRLEVAGDVISGKLMGPDVSDNRVKFGDSRDNLSREIAPEAVRVSIFDGFFKAITCDR